MMNKKLLCIMLLTTMLLSLFSAAVADNDEASVLDLACEPTDIIQTADGSFLVTDAYYKVVLIHQNGETSLYAGKPTRVGLYGEPLGGYRDSRSDLSTFRKPWAIVPFGNGYAVTDTNNNCIRYVTDAVTETIAGNTVAGQVEALQNTEWSRPTGLAADENGNLYVSDTGNNRICFINHATGDVSVVIEGISDPTGLSWCDGSLYIAETGGNRILKWEKALNELTVLAGNGEAAYADGEAAEAAFAWPLGVEAIADGTVFIADSGNCAVRMLKDGAVTTLLMADMEALDQYPSHPQGMLYADGMLYVCDPYANKVYTVNVGEHE